MAKTLSRKVSIYINGKEVESTIKSIEAELRKLKNQQKNLTIGTEEYVQTGLKIREIQEVLQAQKAAVNDLQPGWRSLCENAAEYSNILMGIQSGLEMVGLGVGNIEGLVKEAAALDDAYGQVQKTTGLTHEQVEQLNDLFKKMDTRTSREQLNQLAYEAGKLGIQGVKDVAAFVDASDKINVALGDVLGEGAMVTVGKMAGVYAGSTKELADASGDLNKQMLAIGSAVNELGKLSTANERYLVDFSGRMGGIAVQAGLSADQILGFASALDQDMQKVEMSATAFQKFIGQIMKKPEEFAKQAGMAVADFSQLVRTDLNEALFRVLQGFSGKGGYAELVNIFKDLGLDGARAASVISAMSGSIEKIKVAQAAANEQLRSGQSILGEYDTMNSTLQAQAEKAKKRFEDIRIELGNELYPVLINLQKSGTVLMKGLAGTIQLFKEAPALIAPVVAAIIAWNRATLLKILSSVNLKKVSDALTLAKQREALQTALSQKAAAAERVEKIKAMQVRLQERMAINQTLIAREREKAAMGQANQLSVAMRRQKQLLAAQEAANTLATTAHTAAIEAQRRAFMAMPWGLVITALTAIAAGVVKAVKSSERFQLSKTMKEAGIEVEKVKLEINSLFDVLRKSAEGSEDYKRALDEINRRYPELLKNYIDEKGHLKDIAEAQKAVTSAAIEGIYERLKAEKLSAKQAEVGEGVYGIREKALKFAEKEFKGNEVLVRRYMQLLDQLDGTQANFEKVELEARRTFGRFSNYYNLRGKSLWRYLRKASEEQGKLITYQRKLDMLLPTKKLSPASNANTIGDDKPDNIVPSPVPKVDTGELKKWEDVKARAERLIADFGLKTESGLQKLKDEIADKREAMLADIREAVGASDAQKEALIAQVKEASAALERSKVEEYLKKQTEALQKMRRNLKGEKSDNEYLDKIEEAAKNLASTIATIDEAIVKAQADSKNATDEQRKQLEGLILRYRQLKAEMQATVYSRIDTSVSAKPMSNKGGELSARTAAKVEEKLQSGFGLLFDKGAFEAYGRALESISEQYDKQEQQILKAAQAEGVIIERLREQRAVAASADVIDEAELARLDTEIAKHEEKTGQIQGEQKELERLRKQAEEAAEKDAFGTVIDRWIVGIEKFGNVATEIWGSINKILDNQAERERKAAKDRKDDAIKNLDEQLDEGLISQEEYNEQKEEIEDEYDKKEKEVQKAQWERQKALSLGQAVIESALAIMKAWNSVPWPHNAIPIGIATALGAAQVAAIASEPAPYAKGGYVERRTIYQAGEAGPEWVASNSLLSDPATAPLIGKLEDYQRGNRHALADIPVARLDVPAAIKASQSIGRSQASVPQPSAAAVWEHPTAAAVGSDSRELVNLLRELVTYEKDPRNRQAVISRRTMEDFESNENFLRNKARL